MTKSISLCFHLRRGGEDVGCEARRLYGRSFVEGGAGKETGRLRSETVCLFVELHVCVYVPGAGVKKGDPLSAYLLVLDLPGGTHYSPPTRRLFTPPFFPRPFLFGVCAF